MHRLRSIFPASAVSLCGVLLTVRLVSAAEPPQPRRVSLDDPLPYGQQPIDYHGAESNDAIARLNRRLQAGEVRLERNDGTGYLRSVLQKLDVPVASQVLVFSKTALHRRLVGPDNPRAVYFNDETYVAWTPGSGELEVSALDPRKGAVFYTLSQYRSASLHFERDRRCLTCHAGSSTLGVPGYRKRSVRTDKRGRPLVGYSALSHTKPLSRRWGGWYVTGTHGKQRHLGNFAGNEHADHDRAIPADGANVTDLSSQFGTDRYPSPHSDIVAHLVLDHQVRGQNLLIRVGQEHRLGRRSDAEDRLLRYLLFVDEAPLQAPVRGTSGFAAWFEQQGPRDAQGRSLRDFDLEERLFKYRLSYLVYSPAFKGLPDEVKQRVYRRLWDALHGRDEVVDVTDTIPQNERQAVIDILADTRNDLPKCWRSANRGVR